MPLLNHRGEPFRAQAHTGRDGSLYRHSYEGASRKGAFLHGWRPGLRSADLDWFQDRDQAVARARDVSRNDPVGASAVSRRVNQSVGFRWRLSPKFNARALNISPDVARELRLQVQAKFAPYAYGTTFQSDAQRKKTFGQSLRMSAAHIMQDGEAFGLVEYAGTEETLFKTRLRIVDPDRVTNPYGAPDSPLLRRGIAFDANEIPQGAWIREGHPQDVGFSPNMNWRFWPRYSTNRGRPQVLHAFDELRAGQSRGVTRFVAALRMFRAFKTFSDATLEAVTLDALQLGFVFSQAGPDAVSESLSAEDIVQFEAERHSHYEENPVEVNGARLNVLPFGDQVDWKTATRSTTGFDAFTRTILRLIAAALGLTYEELSMDFSQTNYSSARAALAIAWTETLAFRGLIKAQIADPYYVAWLEEAIDIGEVILPPGAPDFYDAIDAYAQCDWIGPGRGYIDPTKEIAAAAARIEAGISTLERECAEQGDDWEEVADEQAYEKQYYEARGLTYPGATGALLAVATTSNSTAHEETLNPKQPEHVAP